MTEEAMTTPRKRLRKPFFTTLLFRRIHKWVGLILGIQLILWSVTGAVMALLDKERVDAPVGAASEPARTPFAAGMADLPPETRVEGLIVRRLLGRPVYELRGPGRMQLVDARSGEPIQIDAALAEALAREAWQQDSPLRAISLLEEPNLEARDHGGPMWRIDFADAANSSAYVHSLTGMPLVLRNDTWRVWDFAWMLHNMDYAERKSFNHPLIILVAFGALWLSLSGFYLLFKSFHRRDFAWLADRKR